MTKLLTSSLLLAAVCCFAQPKIEIKLDHADGMYDLKQQAVFTVTVTDEKGPLKEGNATARLTNDGLTQISQETINLAEKNPFTVMGTMDKPGILSLDVTVPAKPRRVGKVFGAAFKPLGITPGAPVPKDFMSFWKAQAKAAEAVPLDARVEPLARLSNDKVDGFKVSFAAPRGRVYGFLTVPKAPGKYPAVFSVPGAGPGALSAPMSDKFVYMTMNVHVYDPEIPGKTIHDSYKEVNAGGMYMYKDIPDREKTYFYHGIIGINRALNWLAKHDKVDAKRMGYHGSSQGGAFGFILGGLNGHLSAIVCNVPAMCDHLGYKQGRLAGWPRFCWQLKNSPEIEAMAQYYDAMNFASFIKVPIRVIVGLADRTCSPSSVYAAYNLIPSADKLITAEVGMGHECWPSYNKAQAWMRDFIAKDWKP